MNKLVPIAGLIALLAIIGIGAVVFSTGTPGTDFPATTTSPSVQTPPQTKPTVSQKVTLVGKMVCLPHRNPGEFQTLECAFGILADNGFYYGLDWSVVDPSGTLNLPMDRKYSVTGILVPVSGANSNFWSKYDIRGIIRVEKYSEVGQTPVRTEVKLRLNETSAAMLGTTIKVWAVTEDSRCPSDVQCIQAGRVKIGLTVDSPSGSSVHELEPGKFLTTETLIITLDKVDPVPVSTRKTPDDEYRFYFTVKNK